MVFAPHGAGFAEAVEEPPSFVVGAAAPAAVVGSWLLTLFRAAAGLQLVAAGDGPLVDPGAGERLGEDVGGAVFAAGGDVGVVPVPTSVTGT